MMTYGTAFLLVAPSLDSAERPSPRTAGLNLGLTALFVGDVTYALYFQDILLCTAREASAVWGP